MAQHFKDLVVWQKAMDMVTEVYKLTDSFPKREVTASPIKSAAQRFRFQATLPRDKRIAAIANSAIS
jgi:23S rRNA-intervening sequence protein